MKLATLKNATRDGRLVVVTRDLTRCTDASFLAPTLQRALDDWARVAPHLAALAESLEHGAVPAERFHEHDAMSPLPRAFRCAQAQDDGSWRETAGDGFSGPRDGVIAPGTDIAIGLAAILGDLAAGDAGEIAADAAMLVMAAAFAGEATVAFSPVAVTPDELDGAPQLTATINGKTGRSVAIIADFAALAANAAKWRAVGAGAIVATGSASLAKSFGRDGGLGEGETARIEAKDAKGHSLLGAIEMIAQARPV
ncbi:MAG: hypothetical protein IPL47_02060 [Phyllobacteriaceae bacterium]|nr:hypothetical protein [Phyllobacteriaceae bacterium]